MNKPEESRPQEHDLVLHRHYRWMRTGVPLTVLLIGLLLTLVAIFVGRAQQWAWEGRVWAIGVVVSAGAALLLWAVRRMSLRERARKVDDRLGAKNRLETAAQFATIEDPVIRAQREETADYLQRKAIHHRPTWLPWLVGAAALLLMAHAATWLEWTQPWHTAKAEPKPVASPTPPPTLPVANITFKSPKSETKAAAIEEVPLEAVADSTSGLKNLSLEIEVNGSNVMSVPVPIADLAKPGPHKIETSIYMDQLSVQPFDMVSYYLRADRITSMKAPETASGMQFVEIKPFRDDVVDGRGNGQQQQRQQQQGNRTAQQQQAQDALNLAGSMKVAQLRLLKENFTLSHSDIAHTETVWKQENTRVGGEQDLLAKKADQVQQLMIQNGEAAEIVDLVAQAKPLIGDAAKKIQAEQNVPAIPVQGKALATITEIEKYITHVLGDMNANAAAKQQPHVADPFEKQKDVKLKKRQDTLAGQLENLAREQKRLSDDLDQGNMASDAPQPGATPADPNKITGTPTERQTKIAQQVAGMLNGSDFDEETTGHLQKGHDSGEQALQQLDADDPNRAREPAATAAQELQAAVDSMNRAGQQQAQQQMDAALHDMNNAAQQAQNAPNQPQDQKAQQDAKNAAQQVNQTQQKLADEAQKQQEAGSEKAAAQMAALSKALNDKALQEQLQKLQANPRDAATAQEAAQRLLSLAQRMTGPTPQKVAPTREQLASLADSLTRERVNLARLAQLSAAAGAPELPQPPQLPQVPKPGLPTGLTPGMTPGPSQTGTSPGPGREANAGGQQPGQQPGQGQGNERGQGQGQQGQTAQNGQGQGERNGNGQTPGQQGQRQGQGQQQGQGQGNQQGQLAQNGQGSGQGNRPANGRGGGNNPNGQPQPGDSGAGGGGGNEGGPGANGGQPRAETSTNTAASQRRQFAQDLLDQIQQDTDAVGNAMPNSPVIMQAIQKIHKEVTAVETSDPNAAVFVYGKLNEPLSMMIAALNTQLSSTERQGELTDQSAELAPPAYRSAVADYFERLSRDYQVEPPPAPAEEKAQ